jgi:tetratricopeptide (TPR) repeat protein
MNSCLAYVLMTVAMTAQKPIYITELNAVHAPGLVVVALDDRLPLTKLRPAVLVPNLCLYRYRVSTTSEQCQAYLDQALGYYYSYVWIEAARSAETALRHDPNCAYAWVILHKGIEKWGRGGNAMTALKKAQELLPKASHREQFLINSRLYLKGVVTAPDAKKKAASVLDEMLTIYDDDEEGWFNRGSIMSDSNGGSTESAPFYKALLHVNPLHPGANHEFVHFYEGSRRPALGWKYAEGYIASSPGIPHAFHMQSHLAMRIGKWDKTSDRSWHAIALQRQYHRVQGVKASEDHQFAHHLETLTLGLLHDGRFQEAEAIKKEAESYGYEFTQPWFRLALATRQWNLAEAFIDKVRKDKSLASYMTAVLYLEKGDTKRASSSVDSLREVQKNRKNDRRLENRLNETQGRLLCQTGSGEAGLKLLERNVTKTKDDYSHHAWGGGAYYMEAWGMGALEAGNAIMAEEAFLEALAHDAGSARAALGMQALCERLGRDEEASRYSYLANRLWAKADSRDLQWVRNEMFRRAQNIPANAVATP